MDKISLRDAQIRHNIKKKNIVRKRERESERERELRCSVCVRDSSRVRHQDPM